MFWILAVVSYYKLLEFFLNDFNIPAYFTINMVFSSKIEDLPILPRFIKKKRKVFIVRSQETKQRTKEKAGKTENDRKLKTVLCFMILSKKKLQYSPLQDTTFIACKFCMIYKHVNVLVGCEHKNIDWLILTACQPVFSLEIMFIVHLNLQLLWNCFLWVFFLYDMNYSISNTNNLHTLVWFGLVLWHIKHCWLFNANSSFYIYIKYVIFKHIV